MQTLHLIIRVLFMFYARVIDAQSSQFQLTFNDLIKWVLAQDASTPSVCN